MLRFFAPVALLAALSACEEMEDTGNTTAAPETLSQAQMPDYCRGEASARFGGRPQYITVLPAEPGGGTFEVPGYTENQEQFFTCTFTSDGRFVSIAPT